MTERIKVTLHWVQILDKLEPFYKERGEFRFRARITTDGGSQVQETRMTSEGHYEISDHPAWNKLNLDRVLFEGDVEERLVVELMGEELDALSANDQLDHYERTFSGTPGNWLGHYGPGDDEAEIRPDDPENMNNWRISFSIERA